LKHKKSTPTDPLALHRDPAEGWNFVDLPMDQWNRPAIFNTREQKLQEVVGIEHDQGEFYAAVERLQTEYGLTFTEANSRALTLIGFARSELAELRQTEPVVKKLERRVADYAQENEVTFGEAMRLIEQEDQNDE
jgi:hypothetical protein